MTQRVLVDANVLFSKTAMDWLFLFRLHNPGMFTLYATEDILAEVIANMRQRHPQAPGSFTRRRAELIRENLDEVVPEFSGDIVFTGADPKDYHVHAAAVSAQVDILLTLNKASDFTEDPDSEPYGIYTPDEFFLLVASSSPHCLGPIIEEQLHYWSNRPEYIGLDDALKRAGCERFSHRVRDELSRLA